MPASTPNPDRIHELLADEALQGLSVEEIQELGRSEGLAEDQSLALAAAAADLALFPPTASMPATVRARLELTAAEFIANLNQSAAPPAPLKLVPAPTELQQPQLAHPHPAQPRLAPPSRTLSSRMGWIAAAACLGLAALAWLPRPQRSNYPTGTIAGGTPGGAIVGDFATERQRLLAAPDAVQGQWQDWAADGSPPEIAGVTGDVVFSPAKQTGFLRFVGLPDNPKGSQYQLWIVDQRGMSQRISGALFDAHSGGGELLVPIAPRITVGTPVAFALTIEAPGGTWVSDMKRRVVIATPKG